MSIGILPLIKSQNIKGLVTDDRGVELPFATVQVVGTDHGVVTNAAGFYSLHLDPGNYRIRFQFVGYKTKDTSLILTTIDKTVNIALRPEAVTLPTAVITGDNEDPAYTIMRRTIAKAPYHANQIDRFSARVYIKGSGRILNIPFLFRKRIKKELAKEGIDSTVAFTQESVSRLSYKRPGQYRDTVISIRSSGDDNNTSPMSFISSSFYEGKVAGAVSPLAPNAFSIYNFEYLGFIEDQGIIINKIKVTPKSRGDQVFEGVIYIADQLWNIHSLQLTTYIWGIEFSMKQVYAPVKDNIWMPIDQIFDVGGNVFGFGFDYKYLAHLSEYKITPNPEISVPLVVLDDKKDKVESETANAKIKSQHPNAGFQDLQIGQELSAKQLRKMMKDYKKKELDSIPEVNHVEEMGSSFAESKQYVDSTAKTRDSLYWLEIRPVALTEHEIKGYTRFDSLAKAERQKQEEKRKKDSTVLNINMGSNGTEMNLSRNSQKFKLEHLLTGARFNFNNKKNFFYLYPTIGSIHFNTVEGYQGALKIGIGNNRVKDTKIRWEIVPSLGYSFSLKKINYQIDYKLNNVSKSKSMDFIPWSFKIKGGDLPFSFNPAVERGSLLNDFYSILFKKNYLKLYNKKFVGVEFTIDPAPSVELSASVEYQQRSPLINHSNFSLADKSKSYSSNVPKNDGIGIDLDELDANDAFILHSSLSWTPFYKYVVSNGLKAKDRSGSPKFTVAVKGSAGGDSRFSQIQSSVRQHVKIGAGDDWDFELGYGFFINRPEFFQDFQHFNGNQYIFSPSDPIRFYRALPYFSYSTQKNSVRFLSNYQFRKFIFTTIPYLRRKGIRENIIANALWTKEHGDYAELGYSINYVFRFLRLEAVTTWEDRQYRNTQFRFGLATGFNQLFR